MPRGIQEGPLSDYLIRHLYNEETTVEKEILDHLQGPALDWRYAPRDEVIRKYRTAPDGSVDERETLLIPLLRQKLKDLNPGIVINDERADRILTRLRALCSNKAWFSWLRGEQTYQFAADEQYKTIRLIDYENLDNNDFLVTNQFTIEGKERCRPDILLFINGIPVVDVEAKTASRSKPDWAEGAKQTRRYSEEIPQLFYSNAFCVGVNETRMKYGAPEARLQYWQQWRDPHPHNIDAFDEMKVSLYGLFNKGNLLDLIRYYILFITKGNQTVKKIARYQQYRAANKLVERAVEQNLTARQRRGLIWHTQGSGKTLTMIFAARKLWNQPELNQPTIIVLVDREQLEDQMSKELFATDTDNWAVANSRRDLETKLREDYRGVILTTVHKFDGMEAAIARRSNIIVMADEAHRTQEGNFGTYMRAAVPDASLFGFTGTPIERDDLNTPRSFGQELADGKFERYMDSYTVQDSLRDGSTVPIHFMPRLTDWQLWAVDLDRKFNQVFAYLSEEERNRLARQESKLDAILKHPKRIAQITEDVVQHFKEHVRPNRFKAMLVCKDKQACVLYKQALDRWLEPEASLVVISEAPREDPESVKALYLGDKHRKQAVEQFVYPSPEQNDPARPFQEVELLIVCDMLLTGFDAPICQTMYLDKGLRGHTLLQAIARVNRPYNELKQHGMIVDYYGVFDNLNDALNYRSDELGEVAFPFQHFYDQFKAEFDTLWTLFEDIEKDGSHQSFMRAMVYLNDDEDARAAFEKGFRNLRVLYEVLEPDDFLRGYIRPYAWLTKLYLLYRKKFFPKEYFELTEADGAKTQELIRDHIDMAEIRRDFPTYVLDENYLTKIKEQLPDAKALEIEATLAAELQVRLEQDEEFQPLSERLQRIIEQKRAGTLAGIALIEELEKITGEVIAAIEEAKRPVTQTIALVIKERVDGISDEKVVEVTQAILAKADEFCFEGWEHRPDIETTLTREFTLLLADNYRNLGLIGAGKDFVSHCIRLLKRTRYKGNSRAT